METPTRIDPIVLALDVEDDSAEEIESQASPAPLTSVEEAETAERLKCALVAMPPARLTHRKYFKSYADDKYHEFVVCLLCYDKFKDSSSINEKKVWEVKAGKKFSTSKLTSHLHTHHMDIYKNEIELKHSAERMADYVKRGVEGKILSAVVKFIVMSHQPISLTTCPHFREFIAVVAPKVSLFSHETILAEIHKEAMKCRRSLSNMVLGESIAITCDCWTSGRIK